MQITQLNDGSCVVQALDAWDSYVLNEVYSRDWFRQERRYSWYEGREYKALHSKKGLEQFNEDCDYDFPDGTDEPDWWKADLDYDPDERFGWS